MVTNKELESFDDLRALAHRLDLRLGTEKRKLILEGHEQLTLTTDALGWERWNNRIALQLKSIAGIGSVDEL